MGRANLHLGAAFLLLLLALSLGSLRPVAGGPQPLRQLPDLRIRGSSPDAARPLGPCPAEEESCDVVAEGLDRDGLPTWWHRDGTVVKVVSEPVRGRDGGVLLVPVVVTAQG